MAIDSIARSGEPAIPADVEADFLRLHESAAALAGLRDFGNTSYHEALIRLLRAMAENPNMLPSGRARCEASIVGGLVGRLLSEQGWKDHPEVLNDSISRPIIIAGLPRTGTTILYKLLSIDPQFQKLEFWLGNTPMKRPPRETWESYPEYRQTAEFVEDFYRELPEMRAIHDMAADEPEEDRALLLQEYAHLWYMECAHLPDYERYVMRCDLSVGYKRFADNLKLIGANDPDKRWVLKDPVHLMFMDNLLDTFPDACIVQTHRDPVESIPSLCSLVSHFRSLYENPDCDPLCIGESKVEQWSSALNKTLAIRNSHPGQFIDIHFHDLRRNPMAMVEKIYRFVGIDLDDDVRASMVSYLESNKQGKHGAHRYRAEDFGLSRAVIAEQFRDYMRSYGIASEQ